VLILGAVMFFSSSGVILRTNIQFLNVWIAIIGAVVAAIQWVEGYFKQRRIKGLANKGGSACLHRGWHRLP
jgi:hypothetical protein